MPLGANKAAIFGVAGVSTADVVLLSENTDTTDLESIDITSGIDSTYGEYIFKFYNINPATDNTNFSVQFNVAGGSGFNETVTTTYFNAYHQEDDGAASLGYTTGSDQAEGTAYQSLADGIGNASDESCSGVMHLFNPASTTYVKHFYSRCSLVENSPAANDIYVAGYVNATAAVDEVSFKMSAGNFDGKIKMWGVK